MKKVALIGGGGFIGHHLSLALKKRSYEPYIIDSYVVNNLLSFLPQPVESCNIYWNILNQRIELLKDASIPIHIDDARNLHQLKSTLDIIRPDIIIFLAAVAHADRSNKWPLIAYENSFQTLQNSLECAKNGVEHFVFFSSSMVYGNFKTETVNENDECEPLGIYGTLKYCGEKLVKAYNQVFGLPYTIIRPSALYGPRCISRRIIQVFIEKLLNNEDLKVQGDGKDRLDFTHIEDLVQGVIKCLENEKAKGEIFNITYGKSREVNEVINILKPFFPDLKVNYVPRDRLIPSRGTLSVEKAKNILSYSPSFPIEKGVVSYLKWYESEWENLNTSSKAKVLPFKKPTLDVNKLNSIKHQKVK